MGSSTTAERRRLAYRRRTYCLRRTQPSRPPQICNCRGSITHPIQSLCTLRDGRHLPPRNTHYRAPATAYSGRTSTGWNAPASWRTDRSTTPQAAASTGADSAYLVQCHRCLAAEFSRKIWRADSPLTRPSPRKSGARAFRLDVCALSFAIPPMGRMPALRESAPFEHCLGGSRMLFLNPRPIHSSTARDRGRNR